MSYALQNIDTMFLSRYRGVIYRIEPFSSLAAEGGPLFRKHYHEASADLTIPLNVNWPVYRNLEKAGIEVCVTARRGGTLIGYAVYILVPHMHYKHVTVADSDVFFIDPRYRYGWVGVHLFRAAERALKIKGVTEIWQRVKLHVQPGRGGRDLGVLFKYMGYRPVEMNYRKRIR